MSLSKHEYYELRMKRVAARSVRRHGQLSLGVEMKEFSATIDHRAFIEKVAAHFGSNILSCYTRPVIWHHAGLARSAEKQAAFYLDLYRNTNDEKAHRAMVRAETRARKYVSDCIAELREYLDRLPRKLPPLPY